MEFGGRNNNFLAEPVTFIIVPHRRYTLPFVSRNVYIEELQGGAEDWHEVGDSRDWNNDTEMLLNDSTLGKRQGKEKFGQILSTVIANLMRETKEGVMRRGRVLRRKLGFQRRSKSTGYLVRDRFHLCPPCRKLQKVKRELARMRGPALEKIKHVIKSAGIKSKQTKSESSKPRGLNADKIPITTGIYRERNENKNPWTQPQPANLSANANNESPDLFLDKCPLIRSFMKFKVDFLKSDKDKNIHKVARRQSSFYIDEGVIERRLLP